MKRIAIFASGAGSNALNLIEKSFQYPKVSISCVIVDKDSSPLPAILESKYPKLAVYKSYKFPFQPEFVNPDYYTEKK